jgi:hypothetical protein
MSDVINNHQVEENEINQQGIGVELIKENTNPNKKIDKVVYSLWTKPSGNILKKATNWHSPKAQLYSLAISVLTSKKQFNEIEFITDDDGARVLQKLHLPINIKSTLNHIPKEEYGFWALGKIEAYKQQDKPFIHMDYDSMLWKPLPDWVHNSELFVQNTEDKAWFHSAYQPEINHANKVLKQFPVNWNKTKEAYCTGIFGGNNIDFIQYYCEESLKFIRSEQNKRGWNSIQNKGSYCIIFEQYLLACLADEKNINVTFFDKHLNKQRLADLGYTHIWGAKKSAYLEKQLRDNLKKLDPLTLHYVEKLFNRY